MDAELSRNWGVSVGPGLDFDTLRVDEMGCLTAGGSNYVGFCSGPTV